MNKKCIIFPLMLVFLLAAPSWAQEDGNASAPVDAANESNQSAPSALNLNYIWSFSGIEAGPVSMAIDQEGSDLIHQGQVRSRWRKGLECRGHRLG